MNRPENSDPGWSPQTFGAALPIAPIETFVWSVYSCVDRAAARRVERLRREDGITPTCTPGCCHCCRFHILMNVAEAYTLAQHVKRHFSAAQIEGLRARTQRWHDWDNSRPGRYPQPESSRQCDHSDYDYCCPLLENGLCSAYPVRPTVCRTHYVSSHPRFCRAAGDSESGEQVPVVLTSVSTAALPFSNSLKALIDRAGLDYSRSIMLLPHWLAIQMGWDFAVNC